MISWLIALITSVYFMNGNVIDIEDGNVIIVETDDGNVWAIEDTREISIGENVTVKFYTNLTDDIEDDEIVTLIRERR